jgi:hypothetical protein
MPIQEPERGILSIQEGKIANNENGNANANAKPAIPTNGESIDCIVDNSTNNVPMIGPVQENDTITSTNAMNKMLIIPVVLEALLFKTLAQDDGNSISK